MMLLDSGIFLFAKAYRCFEAVVKAYAKMRLSFAAVRNRRFRKHRHTGWMLDAIRCKTNRIKHKVHSHLPRDNDKFASQPLTTLARQNMPSTSRSFGGVHLRLRYIFNLYALSTALTPCQIRAICCMKYWFHSFLLYSHSSVVLREEYLVCKIGFMEICYR